MSFIGSLALFGRTMPGTLSQGVLWGIMALGVYITYKILDFPDLTVDGSFALGGAVSAILVDKGWNPLAAVLIATCAGMAAGFCTGILHTKLKIVGLLAGILTMIAMYSINLHVMGQPNVSLLHMNTVFTGLSSLLGLGGLSSDWVSLILGVIVCVIMVTVMYGFFGTEIGYAVRATGNNLDMSRALGCNTDWMIMLGLIFSNGLVGLSGGLIAQQQGFADVQMGVGTIVIGLASVIIGEVFFSRFHFYLRFCGAIVGSIIYRMIMSLIMDIQIGNFRVGPNDLKLVTAIIVIIALAVPIIKNSLKRHSHRKGVAA